MDFWPVVGYALVAFHGPPLEVSTQGTPGWRGLPKSTPTAPRPVKSVKTSMNEKLQSLYNTSHGQSFGGIVSGF